MLIGLASKLHWRNFGPKYKDYHRRKQEMRANAYETRDNIGAATSGISVQRAISRFEAVTQI